MTKKSIFLSVFLLITIYQIYFLFQLDETFDLGNLDSVEQNLSQFQLSIWLSWIIFMLIAVYYKWTRRINLFFTFTYIFLLIFFGIFAFYTYRYITEFYAISEPVNVSFGVLLSLQNLFFSVMLTAFLQICTWWFTRRFHR